MRVGKSLSIAFISVTLVMLMVLGAYVSALWLGAAEEVKRPVTMLAWGTTLIFLGTLFGVCTHSWRVLARQGDQVELDQNGQLPMVRESIGGVLTYNNVAKFVAPSTIMQGSQQQQVTVRWAPDDVVPEGYHLMGRLPDAIDVAEFRDLDRLFRGTSG